jgi:hypothetical protein
MAASRPLKKDESSSSGGGGGSSSSSGGGSGILPAGVVPHLCHGTTQSDDATSRKRPFIE